MRTGLKKLLAYLKLQSEGGGGAEARWRRRGRGAVVALPGRGGRAPPELRGRAAAGGGAGARGRGGRWRGRGGRWRAVEEDSVSDREIGEEDDARFYSQIIVYFDSKHCASHKYHSKDFIRKKRL
jgi:hypothetical protein